MSTTILIVFALVYLGMIVGGIPGLALDRAGVALLGAIALIVAGAVTPAEAWNAMDVTTLGLLFGLMIVSAQLRLGGFYTALTQRLAMAEYPPHALLGALVMIAGVLSAVLANDIVCLAMAPILAEGCCRRRLNPVPFLLALACASNVGSAATLIGNPQNMLIGQALKMSFAAYLGQAVVPVAGGLIAVWAMILWRYKGMWGFNGKNVETSHRELNVWQTGKGIIVVIVLMGAFLFMPVPREVVAMGAAGVLLLSRRMASRDMLRLVDWNLLILFIGLFVVNDSIQRTGMIESALTSLQSAGLDPHHPGFLYIITALLSNILSNVPAVMLLLPAATHPMAGTILALSSTLAGNLLIVGSIANIIVVDQAANLNIRITWLEHLKTGVPITLLTLVLTGGWLWLIA